MIPPIISKKEMLEAKIKAAFNKVTPPDANELLQPAYANNEDACELRSAFADRRWTELPIRELFRHREMLLALSGAGYQAYVPAYLLAALTDDEQYGADLRHYLLYGLRPLSDGEMHVRTTRERLSRLDTDQRAAIAEVLQYLGETWCIKEAAEILSEWR
jgi:hypothetical protein